MEMKHETIIRRESGDQVMIECELLSSWREVEWRVRVMTREKRKRLWQSVVDVESLVWRRFSKERRQSEAMQKFLEVATEAEILHALHEAWLKFKPKSIDGISYII